MSQSDPFATLPNRSTLTRRKGLGDMVHSILHPIAEKVDKVLGTDLVNCRSCKDRRELLNRFYGR